MEIDLIRKDSEDDKVDAAVEAVEEQVAMITGPPQTHKKHRDLKELLQSGGVAPRPQPRPSTVPSSSSHGLNKAASAVARQGEPLGAAAEEPAAAGSPSSARSGTVPG